MTRTSVLKAVNEIRRSALSLPLDEFEKPVLNRLLARMEEKALKIGRKFRIGKGN